MQDLETGARGEGRIVKHLCTRLERSGFAVTVVPARFTSALVAVLSGWAPHGD